MSASRTRDLIARYSTTDGRSRVKGGGGLACAVFAALLGCAFWAGAVVASTPLLH